MLPIFNPNPFQSSQLQPNGNSPSTPQQQVMGTNPGNYFPNPMQIGGVINPQLNQFAPFPFQGPSNLNPVAMNNNNNVTNFNTGQQMGQFLPQNNVNPSQFFNQNVNLGMPNGQWNLHNPMQNVNTNPFFQMGIPNLGQILQGFGPQDLAFLAKSQLGFLNAGVANQMPNAGLQLQGNLGSTQAFNSVQPLQNQNMVNQPQSQGNPGKVTDCNQMRANWKKRHNKNYIGNPKHDASHSGPMKSHFHHKQTAKGNFRAHKEQRGKGPRDVTTNKPAFGNSNRQNQGEKKRPLLLSYTDQEIRQWREERRKNYPSKANVEKKLTGKLTEPDASDTAAKLRRQQLKEILAKQAELGCEVAEIPSSYLSDSEQQVHGRGEKRPFNKKERFQNFNKRGKFHQNDRFSKRQRSGKPDSSNTSEQNVQLTKKQTFRNNEPTSRGAVSKREPTLLQKLLSADIKRDRQHLLQVFRFMVMNSFFKDWPEKALKFPTVLVKESENEGKFVEEKGVTEIIQKTGIDESIDEADASDTKYDDNDEAALGKHDQERVGIEELESQEEEGEIID